MARKTKEEALATRGRILDAAELLFHRHGVARTSLHDIALAAGVTRGAVYWHFTDKGAVFNAMLDRVLLPMEEAGAILSQPGDVPALPTLRAHLLDILRRVSQDEQMRRVCEIVMQKSEYVEELSAVRDRRLQMRRDFRARLATVLRRGQRRGVVVASPAARHLAVGLHALLDGLIQNWLLDPADSLRATGAKAIDVHLAGLARV
jgi:TetR/AcrR family acrAB operon transcriptional repressor